MFTKINPLVLLISLLGLAALACQAPNLSLGGGDGGGPTVEISADAAANLIDRWRSTFGGAGGPFSLTMSEEELSSFVALRLEQTADNPFENVRILLRDGQMDFYATYNAGGLNADLNGKIAVEVTAAGGLRFVIQEAKFGPLAVPAEILTQFQTQIDSVGDLTSVAGENLTFSSVVIADGQMTLEGTYAP